jgi:hypothetical protein
MSGPSTGNTGDTGPDVPWESNAPNAYRWTLAAFTSLTDGKLGSKVTIKGAIAQASTSGECPRCTHQFSYTQVLQAVVGESLRTLGTDAAADSSYLALTVPCQCSESHTGRPDGITQGCGINFRIEVRPQSAQ